MKKFFQEVWARLKLPSPSFFQIIQWLSAAVAFVTGLPQLLASYQAQLPITFPAWIFTFSNKAAMWAGVIGFFVAKLPVKNDSAISVNPNGDIKPLLPFTKANS
jgi:hypothetical protein